MIVGQKVVCINDQFPIGIEKFYNALPKKDSVYVVRQVSIGVNFHGELGEVCLLLVGLTNPRSEKAPFPERGFNSERFVPLEELQQQESRTHEEETVAETN